jgi:predicted metal-binding protein
MQDEVTLFRERQHFRQGWLWALLLGTGACNWCSRAASGF